MQHQALQTTAAAEHVVYVCALVASRRRRCLCTSGVNVARMLIDRGDLVLIADSQGVRDIYSADGNALDKSTPLVVLVNKGTASASEVKQLGMESCHTARHAVGAASSERAIHARVGGLETSVLDGQCKLMVQLATLHVCPHIAAMIDDAEAAVAVAWYRCLLALSRTVVVAS